MSDEAWDFLVARSDFHEGVFEASTAPEDFERDGGVLLKVDTFALTANKAGERASPLSLVQGHLRRAVAEAGLEPARPLRDTGF